MDEALADRTVLRRRALVFTPTHGVSGEVEIFGADAVHGDGAASIRDAALCVHFTGAGNVHQARLKFSRPFSGNGVMAHFKISGWREVRYVALGYSVGGAFRNIRCPHIRPGQWLSLALGHADLAYGIQNGWERPETAEITDVRLYIKGTPEEGGAYLHLQYGCVWQEAEDDFPVALPPARTALPFSEVAAQARLSDCFPPLNPALIAALTQHLSACFLNAPARAEAFMREGGAPLYGDYALPWPFAQALPPALADTGTHRFSWHALHPMTILLLQARETGNTAMLHAARDLLTAWLERSYYTPDADRKFAWYDHGAAERVFGLVLMWQAGLEQRFDQRFMARLLAVIFRHAQLLDSEVFYAMHQPIRYHNHAWFQDIALMVAALAFPQFPCAARWYGNAAFRLRDQINQLTAREGGYAVCVENSIGYHHGIQRLLALAGALAGLSAFPSELPAIARELERFSALLRYPDDRLPAQGATRRQPNHPGPLPLRPYTRAECTVLSKAGYAVVKGNHARRPFMLCLFATSLCATHKHEDNLSFTLFFDGVEWLTDPSYYSHETAAALPAYLRSAFAHNAVALEGRDYSTMPGLCALEGTRDGMRFCLRGHHTAYGGAHIDREIHGALDRLELTVTDRIRPEGEAPPAYLMLQCGEGVGARAEGSLLHLTHPHSAFTLRIRLPGADYRLYHGQAEGETIRGVCGLGFLEVIPITTVECRVECGVAVEWEIEAAGGA